MDRKLVKSATNRKIAGVCGGLGEHFGIDPTIVRLLFVLAVLYAGHGILLYIVLALVMPEPQSVRPVHTRIDPPAVA